MSLEVTERKPLLQAADVTISPLQAGIRYHLTGPLAHDDRGFYDRVTGLPGLGFGTLLIEGEQYRRHDLGDPVRVRWEARIERYRRALQRNVETIRQAGAAVFFSWVERRRAERHLLAIDALMLEDKYRPSEKMPRIAAILRRYREGR